MDPDEISDEIYDIVNDAEPADALHALTAVVMGTAGRCRMPHRALLAVISELTDLVRFMEMPDGGAEETVNKAPSHQDWLELAWSEYDDGETEDGDDETKAEDGAHRALASWTPRGKQQ